MMAADEAAPRECRNGGLRPLADISGAIAPRMEAAARREVGDGGNHAADFLQLASAERGA